MLGKYFVSPPQRSGWSLRAADLRERLLRRYPGAEARAPDSDADAHQLHWTIPSASGTPLDGSLQASGQALHLDGDVDDAAEFAVWFRSLVPARQPLLFYDEGYSADVEITPDSRPEDLAAPFLA